MTRNTRITGVVCCFAALLFVALSLSAATKQPQMKRIYMFGFSASLTDSTAYLTDIQTLDSAWIDSHKFLQDRALYSLQLQSHVEAQEHHKNTVCTVYFNTKPRKLQRKWAKVKKRYEKDPVLRFTILPRERFAFTAEEYRPVMVGESEVVPDTTQTASAKSGSVPPDGKKSKKSKKKSKK